MKVDSVFYTDIEFFFVNLSTVFVRPDLERTIWTSRDKPRSEEWSEETAHQRTLIEMTNVRVVLSKENTRLRHLGSSVFVDAR